VPWIVALVSCTAFLYAASVMLLVRRIARVFIERRKSL
jgi:hypothetical protein